MGVPDWTLEDIGEVPEEWPWRQTKVSATLRASPVSQHTPTAVPSPCLTTASQQGQHETATQSCLKALYVRRKGSVLFCSREMEWEP